MHFRIALKMFFEKVFAFNLWEFAEKICFLTQKRRKNLPIKVFCNRKNHSQNLISSAKIASQKVTDFFSRQKVANYFD